MSQLDLSVPETGNKNKNSSAALMYVLLCLLIIISGVNTYFLINCKDSGTKPVNGLTPASDELKKLALKLEKQELNDQAVSAWKQYLAGSDVNADETAKIWYRIGKIYQAKGEYKNALNAFYYSESFASPADIKNEINSRIQDCLESAGKFAALRYELDERVNGNESNSGENVVAEIGAYKITREELDKKIEKLIEQRITGLSRYLPEDRINKEKENLLMQYSSENGRRMFLEQFIAEEVLYRKAREEGLAQSPQVTDALKEMERNYLASKVIENSYKDKINITAVDVKNFYEANKSKYIKKQEDGTEQQLTFDEARDRVSMDLMAEKEKDVQRNLLSMLRDKYNVVVHNSALSPSNSKESR